MNVFKMNQIAFGKTIPKGKMPLPCAKKTYSKRVFSTLRKPGNWAVFVVSFLTYLVGIFPSIVFALPKDPTIESGSLIIDTVSPKKMSVYQDTEKAIINWSSFNIDK